MICLSWNCQGMGNPRTVCALKDIIIAKKANLIFLYETLIHQIKIEQIKYLLAYDGCFCVDHLGRGGGLAILWKNVAQFDIISFSPNFVDVFLMVGSLTWRL